MKLQRVGGRTFTVETTCGHSIDMGANWIGPTQDYIYELVKEFGLKTQPQFDTGKNVLDLNGKLSVYEGNIGQLTMFGRPPGEWIFPLKPPLLLYSFSMDHQIVSIVPNFSFFSTQSLFFFESNQKTNL